MARIPVDFYCNKLGVEPVREWLVSLPKEDCKAIGACLLYVQENWPVRSDLVRSLNFAKNMLPKTLYEMKYRMDRKNYRVFFCLDEGKIILVHGMNKENDTAGDRGMRVAADRVKEYFR